MRGRYGHVVGRSLHPPQDVPGVLDGLVAGPSDLLVLLGEEQVGPESGQQVPGIEGAGDAVVQGGGLLRGGQARSRRDGTAP